jgi:signal transduction histidine kinase
LENWDVPDPTLVQRLTAHRTLGGVPVAELEWLAEHGELMSIAPGEVVSSNTSAILGLYVILSGHISITVNRGSGPRKVMEWRGGELTGLLPYSRMTVAPGVSIAEEPTEALLVRREQFRELVRECHEVVAICVHVMLDRARHFTSSDLSDEKMVSLGKLAAGLAHELNNPASAVARSAKELCAWVSEIDEAWRGLTSGPLSAAQLAELARIRARNARIPDRAGRSAMELADREDGLAAWLGEHGVDDRFAETLAGSALSPADLDPLVPLFDPARLEAAVRCAAADFAVRSLTGEIGAAASRIHALVSAVKGFTYMDQATVPRPINVGKGLSDTLTVLARKARDKSVNLALDVEPNLPSVDGFGGELNQVWSNLIDNALDAVAEGGHVSVAASAVGPTLVVRVVDDGPGIPDEIRDRIFDPFFTTKDVGKGTGLGLDIARRFVKRHKGEIEVDTRPGRSEFRVILPASIA